MIFALEMVSLPLPKIQYLSEVIHAFWINSLDWNTFLKFNERNQSWSILFVVNQKKKFTNPMQTPTRQDLIKDFPFEYGQIFQIHNLHTNFPQYFHWVIGIDYVHVLQFVVAYFYFKF